MNQPVRNHRSSALSYHFSLFTFHLSHPGDLFSGVASALGAANTLLPGTGYHWKLGGHAGEMDRGGCLEPGSI